MSYIGFICIMLFGSICIVIGCLMIYGIYRMTGRFNSETYVGVIFTCVGILILIIGWIHKPFSIILIGT